MSHEMISLDFGHVRETVGGLSREQETFAAEVAESLAALEAFQAHLDVWQKELGEEREALAKERAVQAAVDHAAEAEVVRLTQLVATGRERIVSLENDLLACNEELREAEEKRTEVISQLDAARTREKLLTSSALSDNAKSAQKKSASASRKPRPEGNAEQQPNADAAEHDRQVGDPVLRSVVAQFDKIRRQLAFGKNQSDPVE